MYFYSKTGNLNILEKLNEINTNDVKIIHIII